MKSEKYPVVILASCLATYVIYLALQFVFTDGRMGVPLDDTWIHFRFAENFANGFFFEYNVGEPTAGTTSPLFVILLAGASFISSNYFVNAIFLSAAFHLLSCIVVYRLSESIFSDLEIRKSIGRLGIGIKDAALLVALLTVFTGRFAWSGLSGMETTMFAFFTLWAVYNHAENAGKRAEYFTTSVLIALATVSRPEGFLLYAVYAFVILLDSIRKKNFAQTSLLLMLSGLIFAVIALPYFVFSYSVSGHFFPNTFRGQGGTIHGVPGLNYLRIIGIFFFRDNFVTAMLYISGSLYVLLHFGRLLRGKFGSMTIVLLWVYALPIVSSFLVPNWRHHARYMIPLIPFVNLTAVYFLSVFFASDQLKRVREFFILKPRRYALIVAVSIIYYSLYGVYLGKNTDNINDQQVKIAEWVNRNVGRDETIAVNDIGAIIYINKNRVIDMAGLVTPEILRYRTYTWEDNLDSLNYLLKKNSVSYIIIYDHWFREYLDKYGHELEYITSAVLEENTICGGIEMKVYRTKFADNIGEGN